MESIRVRGSLRGHRVRRIRACNGHRTYAPTADKCFDAARENIFARLGHLCARAKLDLFAAALAQLLATQRMRPACVMSAQVRHGGFVLWRTRGSRYCPSVTNLAPCEFWSQAAPALSGHTW